MLDSAANSLGNIDIISFHLAFPSHMIYTYWRSFISGKLYLLVLILSLDSAANSVGNIVLPFGFSLAYDLQMFAIFYLWNTMPFGAFWGF